jgi:Recombinase/Recombinase zinc beta ribbon domain
MYTEQAKGLKAIANELNQSAMPTARSGAWANHYSGRWALTTIRSILVNPAYAGDMAWNRHTDARFYKIMHGAAVEREDGYGRRLTCNDESHWIVVRDAHEPLVTRRQWTLAQQTLRDKPASTSQRGINPRTGGVAGQRRPVGGGAGPRAKFLLSGLITCTKCGSRYEGYTQRSHQKDAAGNRRKVLQYACGGYIRLGSSVCQLGAVRRDKLEAKVIEAVIRFYQEYGVPGGRKLILRLLTKELGLESTRCEKAIAAMRSQLSELAVKTRNLLDNITVTNRNAVDHRLTELAIEKDALERHIQNVSRTAVSGREIACMATEMHEFCTTIPNVLCEGSFVAKQEALRRCLKFARLDGAKGICHLELVKTPQLAMDTEARPLATGSVHFNIAALG